MFSTLNVSKFVKTWQFIVKGQFWYFNLIGHIYMYQSPFTYMLVIWNWSLVSLQRSMDMKAKDLARYCLRVLFIAVSNILAIPSYLTWYLLLQPLRLRNPALFWRIEAVLFQSLLTIITTWLYSGGYTSKSDMSQWVSKKTNNNKHC